MTRELAELLSKRTGARFWRTDLHVHTPASNDMHDRWASAKPEDVVDQALKNRMEIIAVTDHNSAKWCDAVREAAKGTGLHVFPGVEIATSEGHLLAVFDVSKPQSEIEEFLIRIGFGSKDFGNLDKIADGDMISLAARVEAKGGIAIAAHADREKGFWRQLDKSRIKRKKTYACESLRAFEIVDTKHHDDFLNGRIAGYERQVPCVQGSDSWPPGADRHDLAAIGHRHCLIKMDQVSLFGLRQALSEPRLRIRFADDPPPTPSLAIEGVWVSGGFLDGQKLRFSDDMTCLIGGSGSGKSLTVELIRFALDQSVDSDVLEEIAKSCDQLLSFAMTDYNTVYVLLRKSEARYLVERTWAMGDSQPPTLYRVEGESIEPVEDSIQLHRFFRIKAFSQSEIIEYSRKPLARLSLLDDLIDDAIDQERQTIEAAKNSLRRNAADLIQAQTFLAQERQRLEELPAIEEGIKNLDKLFKHPRVKEHESWEREKAALDRAQELMQRLIETAENEFPKLSRPLIEDEDGWKKAPNKELIERVAKIGREASKKTGASRRALLRDLTALRERLGEVRGVWDTRFQVVEQEINNLFQEQDETGRSLKAMHSKLTRARASAQRLRDLKSEIEKERMPEIARLELERKEHLGDLQDARSAISAERRNKAADLETNLDKKVSIKVRSGEHRKDYKDALLALRSGVRHVDIDQIVRQIHPVRLITHLAHHDFDPLSQESGLSASTFEKFVDSGDEEDRLRDLYELQIVDLEDMIAIHFALAPDTYRDLEALAYGLKCTVVLMIALAEGDCPLLVDQPEDALHAPWIEDYIVASLRSRRGARQFIFATRSANVLVSSHAEQVIGLKSDADRGWIDRTGGLDNFDARDAVVYHLEGGKEPFLRRSRTYGLAK